VTTRRTNPNRIKQHRSYTAGELAALLDVHKNTVRQYVPVNGVSGNLRAICATCETIMHRRIRLLALPAAMPGIDVQIMEGEQRLSGTPCPSLNSDFGMERLA
jgi:hypothetical protein